MKIATEKAKKGLIPENMTDKYRVAGATVLIVTLSLLLNVLFTTFHNILQ